MWIEALAAKGDDIREFEISEDGLICQAHEETFRDLLNHYIRDIGGWYFNSSKDRYIAEIDLYSKRLRFNPQLLWQNGFEIVT